jgi:hypothetical protein
LGKRTSTPERLKRPHHDKIDVNGFEIEEVKERPGLA